MSTLRWRLLPVASRLPEWLLRFLNRRWKLGYDPADGWTYWLDASYARWVRRDMADSASDETQQRDSRGSSGVSLTPLHLHQGSVERGGKR